MKRFLLACATACLTLLTAPAFAGADELHGSYAQLRDELRNNPYGRAMHVDSAASDERLQGDVYAVLQHPFERVSTALRRPRAWCDVLILPFNTKYCHAVDAQGGPRLLVRIGRTPDQPVEQAFRLDFGYRNVAASPSYFESRLTAADGPVGTHDYRITVAAVPLEDGRTFLRLRYSYGYGWMGRTALQVYLSTAGADKVGFSLAGRDASGRPQYIGGVRGVVERNAMRYYLAVDAFLDSLDAPPAQRAERRIQAWFSATEEYPLQLREMDRPTYVGMKREEVERQRTLLQ